MASIFDDEEADFATHKFMKTFLTKRGNNLLEKVELVAFLIDDMEEDILRSLVGESSFVFSQLFLSLISMELIAFFCCRL